MGLDGRQDRIGSCGFRCIKWVDRDVMKGDDDEVLR